MTEQSPVAPQADDDNTAAERAMLRAAGRDGLILVAGLAVLGSVVGYLAVGLPGVWGALIGAALAGLFCGATVLSMMLAVGRSAAGMGAVVMGGWLAKMVILVAVLAVLSRQDFYDRWVLMVVVLLGAVGSAVLDYRAVKGGRVTYVQPDTKA
ncbi:hypothetical protein C8K30_112107 [Promicromonospora sp. AC04]|uniref:hypothetical protein n=1 Tax=Promicromonospora sp. AC04 TaxID=2135723 RepID=UPI000D362507|nr:hypothetical protein [Promicromonospora sp. AC04]PUB22885.1 hypothetical protein C8K30_112107 [Promicromonospora sp. AC04]